MKSALRFVVLITLSSVAIYTPACGSDETQQPPEGVDITGVIYEAGANDEALEALLGATPINDAAKGAALSEPAEGAELPSTAAPTFQWSVGSAGAALSPSAGPRRSSFMSELVGPERAAAAHGPPVNGKAYLLVFSTPADDKLVRVFTTDLSYTPDAAAWDKMKAAGAPITATVLTGTFDNNLLASDGGPFAGPKTSFTVKP